MALVKPVLPFCSQAFSQSALYRRPRVISGFFSRRFLSVDCVDIPLLVSPAAWGAVKVFQTALGTPGVCCTSDTGTEMAETESKILKFSQETVGCFSLCCVFFKKRGGGVKRKTYKTCKVFHVVFQGCFGLIF